MYPTAYAIVSIAKPNARATPRRPTPRSGNAADRTAVPQPPNTSQKVPRNSAAALLVRGILLRCGCRRAVILLVGYRNGSPNILERPKCRGIVEVYGYNPVRSSRGTGR